MNFPFRIYKIHGHSMEPTIMAGSLVLVFTWVKKYKIGDIVAFEQENKIFIKRIAAIIDNQVDVRGDNKTDSHDSRRFGLLSLQKIIGKVLNKK